MSKPLPKPPRLAELFLEWYCSSEILEILQGDLHELYYRRVDKIGLARARLYYYRDVLDNCRPYAWGAAKSSSPNSKDMFINYIISAWRNMYKRKQFTLINIMGLSIGMAACLLILQYVNHQESYDTFHSDLDRLYRLNLGMSEAGESEVVYRAANHPAAGLALKKDYPQIEEIARLVDVAIFMGSSVLRYEPEGSTPTTFYEENMYVADPSFLKLFSFSMIKGDKETALDDRDNIVITESLAKKYFGEEDPMGKTLALNGAINLTVTGILQDLPKNTHLDISALFSSDVFSDGINNAWIWPEFHTYVKLVPNVDVQDVESQLDGFVNQYLGEIMEEFAIKEAMTLQAVKDIHLKGNLLKEIKETGNQKTVSFLVVIAFMILLIAWINFINLSTSRSIERASEVGIRKVVGAGKGNIILQFLTESAVMNGLAIGLAILLVVLTTPYFNRIAGEEIITGGWFRQVVAQGSTWQAMLLLFLGGTFLAGLYPAFVLSSFQPIKTVKGHLYQAGRKIHFRHVMVVFQFVVGLSMITGTLIVFKQLSFMRNQELGFNMDQLLILKAPSIIDSTIADKSELFREQLLQSTQVQQVSFSSDIPGHNIQNINTIKRKEQNIEEGFFATYQSTDEYYFTTYQIDLVAGREFSKEIETDTKAVILNEKAVQMLGFSSTEEVLEQVISVKINGWSDLKVIGVVKNIHNQSLAHGQLPFVFFNRGGFNYDYLNIRLNTEDLHGSIAQIEETYREIFPGNPVEHFFLDDYFDKQYQADRKFGSVFTLFATLAILVACLGLFGLASYVSSLRTKETGIRKVLGATTAQIFTLLAKQFLWLIVVATIVGIPLIWWGGNEWLANYAYRVQLDLWVFVLPVLSFFLITALIVFWQSSKAALVNPVQSLRSE
ncbi:MAG: ABC transporter permease [Saprospiraceae bacterium]|nr:ABC transporter permease [Saprospiraceae bacterium]